MADELDNNTPPTGFNEFGGDADWGDEDDIEVNRGDAVVEDDEPEEVDEETEVEDDTEEETDDEDDPEGESEDESEDDEDDSEDESDDDESDDDDEPEAEKEKAKKPVKGHVPRERLNKEIDKRRALERELQELRSGKESPKPEPEKPKAEPKPLFNADSFKAMTEAMLDEKNDEAANIFGSILQEAVSSAVESTKAEMRAEFESTADQKLNADKAHNAMVQAASQLVQSYPEFDSNSDYADEGLIEDVLEYRGIYEDRGLTPEQALRKAVKLVATENGLEDRLAEKPKAKPEGKVKTRKSLDLDKKVEVAKKEKGRLKGSSDRSKTLDINKMSDAQLDKLSPEAKARLRGDII